MEMLAVDAWKPEWKRWDGQLRRLARCGFFSRRARYSTRPIEYPVQAPKDADAMFDVLTYEKGASVLRMLEQHIGPTVFRDGVRDYLRAHAYRNADTKDLWVSLGKIAKQPVPELMDGWIFQPGFPLVTADVSPPSELTITQQRFQLSQQDPIWPVTRPTMADPTPDANHCRRQGQDLTSVADGKEHDSPAPHDWESVLINEEGHGFYRVRYAPEFARSDTDDAGIDRLAATRSGSISSTTPGLPPSRASCPSRTILS